MKTVDVDSLERRLAEATQGMWVAHGSDESGFAVACETGGKVGHDICVMVANDNAVQNAVLIDELVENAPALIAAYRELKELKNKGGGKN